MCRFQWKAEERLYNLHGVFFQTHKRLGGGLKKKIKTIAEKQSKEEALTLNLSHGVHSRNKGKTIIYIKLLFVPSGEGVYYQSQQSK